MPPASIIILRHGHREDHFNPEWKKTSTRPHDSPLNEEGLAAAVKAGEFAFNHLTQQMQKQQERQNQSLPPSPPVKPEDIFILSSPLIRTIQTSSQFATGLEKSMKISQSSSSSAPPNIRVHIESAMLEPAFWITYDIQKAGFSHLNPYHGFVCHDASYHNKNVSSRVSSNEATKQSPSSDPTPSSSSESSASSATASNSYIHSEQLYDVTHAPDPNTGGFKQLIDDEIRFPAAAKKLLYQSPQFDGKHVVLVGHGASTVRMYNAIFKMKMVNAKHDFDGSPNYTGITMLLFDPERQVYNHLCEPFSTPHDDQ